ncbi:MAG: flavodoxin-dependent (E)-4-hydroxy-3-methylbut-2-enyl-diphosphate synthase [Oscillospiraceae bacterium]|nr:flavodoxin-dependent (E)-4-hydroxy-3-methylbut-2-enyl-diphosphate synthase [Oscillospiraceae bacterium]
MSDKCIMVGGVAIGGGAPVTVQSMTTTKTSDIPETLAQIGRLEQLGCDIVRVAVPDAASAHAIGEIKKQIKIPLVADVHFDHKLAIMAAEEGADKLRINPGNIGGDENVRAVAAACRSKGIPIRVGVNGGSIHKDIIAKHGGVTPEALCESAIENVRLLNRFDFDDICISVKASSVPLTIKAYRLLADMTDYPLHIGVTETGTEYMGLIKSSAGIGALLADGIGDTIRVSLTGPPEGEVKAGLALLKAMGMRPGYELISCPTCGRTRIDLVPIAHEVERRLALLNRDITVAVMGCAVNGPGEASRADYGIAGGDGEGIIFRKGSIDQKVPMDRLVDVLFQVIESEEKTF